MLTGYSQGAHRGTHRGNHRVLNGYSTGTHRGNHRVRVRTAARRPTGTPQWPCEPCVVVLVSSWAAAGRRARAAPRANRCSMHQNNRRRTATGACRCATRGAVRRGAPRRGACHVARVTSRRACAECVPRRGGRWLRCCKCDRVHEGYMPRMCTRHRNEARRRGLVLSDVAAVSPVPVQMWQR